MSVKIKPNNNNKVLRSMEKYFSKLALLLLFRCKDKEKIRKKESLHIIVLKESIIDNFLISS